MKKLATLGLMVTALGLWAPLVVSLRAVSTTVVISEFRVRGPNGGNDEFIELYNGSAASVSIGGWRIQGSNVSGTVGIRATIPAGTTLGAGCHYLVTNSGTSGGPYSGSVPGNQTYATGITDDGGIALTQADNTIVDQVGLSAGSAFKEGTPLASLGGTNLNRGYGRRPGATATYQDTDNNASDFELRTPSTPQNAPVACLGGTSVSVDGNATPNPVVQFETVLITGHVAAGTNPTSTGLSATADLATLGGVDGQPLYDDGSNGDATAGDKLYSYLLAVTAGGGSYSVVVRVSDAQGRTATDTFSVAVQPPPVLYLPHAIQGSGPVSPHVGETVGVEGVVTARRSNGVFVQTVAGEEDGDPSTSEGLFVFTGGAPPLTAQVGTRIRAIGSVLEFSGDGFGQTQTEIAGSPSFVILGGESVPPAVPLTAAELSPNDGFDQLERFEGMRVFITSLTTVSGTDGFFDSASGGEAGGVMTSNGAFFAVLTGTPRPVREIGLDFPLAAAFANRCAAGPPCSIPVFDSNPERLRIDSDALGAPRLDVTTGVLIQNLTAIVDAGFLAWNLLPVPDAVPVPTVGPNAAPLGVLAAPLTQFTVASFNMQRFFDTVNDAGSDVPLTPANYANRLTKASLVIRAALKMPDVIAVQEVEHLSVLEDLAARINTDAGLPDEYTAYLAEGNDPGGIDVGFLVRSRVHPSSVTQEGKDVTFINPDDGNPDTLNDRPPLVLRATIDGPATMLDANVIVVANHLRSLGDVASTTSGRVRAKRQMQAEFLANLLDDLQHEGAVISVGDYNAFEDSDGLVDVMGTVRGVPAPPTDVVLASPDLVDPDFVLATPGAYSYVFEGNAQALDHVLLSTAAVDLFLGVQHAYINADFPEVYRNDPTRVERLSDHDPAVGYFTFPPDVTPPTIRTVTPSVTTLWPAHRQLVPLTIDVDATDNLGIAQCVVSDIVSSEAVNGLGDGDTTPDWIINSPRDVSLRAERAGTGAGRTYTIVVTCQDVAGNVASSSADVHVPHSQGK